MKKCFAILCPATHLRRKQAIQGDRLQRFCSANVNLCAF